MKLMSKGIETKLPAIYTNVNKKPKETQIIVKFFCPWNQWAWYATEGERIEDMDLKFFGWVHGDCPELGFFLLSELESIKGPLGMKIERDMYFGNHMLSEVMEKRL